MSQRLEHCSCITSQDRVEQPKWGMSVSDDIDFYHPLPSSEKICLDYDKKGEAVIPLPKELCFRDIRPLSVIDNA